MSYEKPTKCHIEGPDAGTFGGCNVQVGSYRRWFRRYRIVCGAPLGQHLHVHPPLIEADAFCARGHGLAPKEGCA